MREPVRAAGTIKEAGGGLLHVVGAGGSQWLVKVEAQPQNISFMGTADDSWLQPGMLVRFSGLMDRRLRMTEPLSAVSVISMRQGYVFGVTQEGLATGGNDAPKLFEDAKPEKPAPVKKQPGSANEPMPVLIIGRIVQAKNGKLTLDVGTGKQMKVELAEKARISVDVADLSWARAGDKIELDGWAYPQQKQNVFAQNVTITASNPLSSEKKRPAAPEKADEEKKDEKKEEKKE